MRLSLVGKVAVLMVLLARGGYGIGATENRFVSAEPMSYLFVNEHGRKKPLDTHARILLKKFSGLQRLRGLSAVQWFTEVIFSHPRVVHYPVFRVREPELHAALTSEKNGNRFSFKQLQSSMPKLAFYAHKYMRIPPSARTDFQNSTIRLFENLSIFVDLRETFSFAQRNGTIPPIDSIVPAHFSRKEAMAFPGYHSVQASLQAVSSPVHNKREKTALPGYGTSQPHLIPTFSPGHEHWMTPREAAFDPVSVEALSDLVAARYAFVEGDASKFTSRIQSFRKKARSAIVSNDREIPSGKLEVMHNRIRPFFLAKVMYGATIGLALIAYFSGLAFPTFLPFAILLLGFAFHSFGLSAHATIVGHLPIHSRFGVFVSIAWFSVVIGLVLQARRSRFGPVVAASAGVFLLWLSETLVGGNLMTARTLIAVNHPVSVFKSLFTVLGGACLFIAALLGYIWIFAWLRNPSTTDSSLQASIIRSTYLGFVLVVTGTMLGAAWSEQVSGYFWSWHPQESGNLLVIIWYAILLLAHRGKMIDPLFTAIGSTIGVSVLSFALVGTELLFAEGATGNRVSSGLSRLLSLGFAQFALLTAVVVVHLTRGAMKYRTKKSEA